MARAGRLALVAGMALAAVNLFTGGMCGAIPVTHVDEPAGAFDSIVIDDGKRRVVQAIGGANPATSWSS